MNIILFKVKSINKVTNNKEGFVMQNRRDFRFPKGILTSVNTNIAHITNPNMVLFWSAMFPGLGHILLCQYFTGAVLIIWEFFVNNYSKLNLAIVYSLTGRTDLAQHVINTKFLLWYIPVYIFCFWDVRRIAIDLNKYSILADMTGSVVKVKTISYSTFSNHYLERKNPWNAVLWSFFLPNLGYWYIHRIPSAVYATVWWLITTYYSNILPAIHFTFLGDFQKSTEMINFEWLLFMPSLYGFAMYDTFAYCNNINELFFSQQALYYQGNYQKPIFSSKTTLLTKRTDKMNIVASFKYSLYLDLAIKELEQNGIPNEDIFVIPLTEKEKAKPNMSIILKNGANLYNGMFGLATVFSVLGAIYGFILKGGPVIWGIIGCVSGGAFGLLIDFLIQRRKISDNRKKGKGGEVTIIIHCDKNQVQMVKDILFGHFTMGLSVIH
jgi:hypothetical protein